MDQGNHGPKHVSSKKLSLRFFFYLIVVTHASMFHTHHITNDHWDHSLLQSIHIHHRVILPFFCSLHIIHHCQPTNHHATVTWITKKEQEFMQFYFLFAFIQAYKQRQRQSHSSSHHFTYLSFLAKNGKTSSVGGHVYMHIHISDVMYLRFLHFL